MRNLSLFALSPTFIGGNVTPSGIPLPSFGTSHPFLDEEEGGAHLGVWLVGDQPQNGAEWLVHKLNGTPQTQEWRKRSPTLLTREYKPWADNVPVWATLRVYR